MKTAGVHMSYTSQNFRLIHASNLSVLNLPICLLLYRGSLTAERAVQQVRRLMTCAHAALMAAGAHASY